MAASPVTQAEQYPVIQMYEANRSTPPKGRYLGLYAKLGVSPNASTDAIRLAYQVLAEAYCPDGAYSDDAMHQAFSEIQNAAGILGNPKTRRLYDQGYIDGARRPTEAGLAHARKFRAISLSGGFLALAAAAVLFFGIGIRPSPKPGNSGVQTATLQERSIPSPAREAPPPPQAAANPSSAPTPKAAPETPAIDPLQEAEPAQSAPEKQPSQTASQPNGTPGYLPPAGSIQTHAQALPKAGDPVEKRRRKYAQQLERRRRSEFAGREPSNLWESDIWFPHRSAPYHPEDAPPYSTSRSASCLACLADGGDCPGICP